MAEVLLRLFYPQVDEHDKMFEYDPYLGWRFIPNKRGAIVYAGESPHFIKTNSLGFRDKEPPSDNENISKILVLGDSFVSNISVKDDEVFTEIIERQLYNTRVMNFGVNGYGQVQEYLLLKQWLGKINPELVILVIYIRNDFDDNIGGSWNYPRPLASWDEEDATLRINSPRPPPPKDSTSISYWRFWRKSHLYLLFDERLSILIKKFSQTEQTGHKPSLHSPPELYLCQIQPTEYTKIKYHTMKELLLMIAKYVDERKIPLVFVIAPSFLQVYDERWSSALQQYGEKSENYKKSLPNDKLKQFAEKNNLLMIDLLPILQSEANKGKQLYNLKSQHWNSDGNRVVAYTLLEYLKTKSLIKSAQLR